MSFKGKHATGTKIVRDEYSLQKASHFKYPGKYTTLKYGESLDRKFNRFQRIKGTTVRTNKQTRIWCEVLRSNDCTCTAVRR
jgi:hypothetical protein